MTEPRDISMVDVSNALSEVNKEHENNDNQQRDDQQKDNQQKDDNINEQHQHQQHEQSNEKEPEQHHVPVRRKSTLILTDEDMKIDSQNQSLSQSQSESGDNDETDMQVDKSQTNLQQQSQQQQQQQQQQQDNEPDLNTTVPVEIRWTQGGEKVYVTGSFTGWRKMIGLARQPDNSFLITLGLPIGTHRFRFVIDNELRFSDYLPTATDQMGNFVNYVEVTPENVKIFLEQQEQERLKSEEQPEKADSTQQHDQDQKQQPPSPLQSQQQQQNDSQIQPPQPPQYPGDDRRSSYDSTVLRKSSISRTTRSDSMWGLTNDDDDMGGGYSRYHDEDGEDLDPNHKKYDYIVDIPPIFIDPKVMEQYYIAIEKQSKSQNGQQAWLHPPQLPPHLENVILNNFNSMDRDNNSGALPIPNHVVLNHLATTSIKHNTLSVASVVRYKRKYVTQVLYAPLQL